jgi:hypothetical protein
VVREPCTDLKKNTAKIVLVKNPIICKPFLSWFMEDLSHVQNNFAFKAWCFLKEVNFNILPWPVLKIRCTILIYGKPAMTCFKNQVYNYMYGSETITNLNAILNLITNDYECFLLCYLFYGVLRSRV